MEYAEGKLGRVFVARLEEGESVYEAVESIAEKEKIACASVMAIGGMESGKVVTGPENRHGKIVPHFEEFDEKREIVGVGTLFPQNGKPSLHFHAGMGRRDKAIVGCPRAGMSVFLVLEVVIIEILGIDASRKPDPELGVHLLMINSGR